LSRLAKYFSAAFKRARVAGGAKSQSFYRALAQAGNFLHEIATIITKIEFHYINIEI
jgi:hypothetical protein